jgi:hypothetical protein
MGDDLEYDESEHRKLLFAHFGAAFYLANCFEHGLAIALMYAAFLTEQREFIKKHGLKNFDQKKYETEFDTFFQDQFS